MSKHHHIGLLNIGRAFYKCAIQINNGPQLPVYYLYFHAVELALKSYIYFINQNENELKTIGHNLQSAWSKAFKMGIADIYPENQELQEYIKMINPLYKGKELEYFYPGLKRLPAIDHVNNSAHSLLRALEYYYRIKLKSKA